MRYAIAMTLIGMMLAGNAFAALNPHDDSIALSGDITVDTRLAKDGLYEDGALVTASTGNAGVYHLEGIVFVRNMASLTIEAGVTIASDPDLTASSLIVSRDSQIFVQGTADEPVIMKIGRAHV